MEKSGAGGQAQTTPGPSEGGSEPWGGEVRVKGGAAPSLLRRVSYGLFVWAVLYLLLHPRLAEGQLLLWTAAVLLAGWAILRLAMKRPPEI